MMFRQALSIEPTNIAHAICQILSRGWDEPRPTERQALAQIRHTPGRILIKNVAVLGGLM